MKILRVGDPHAKVACLEELKALILFIVAQAILRGVDRIEILGDLFHTHNVIRLEVLEFWTWALDLLSKTCETVVLVGNHDLSGDCSSTFSALSVFGLMNKPNLHIIEKPTQMGVFGYVPYTSNADSFTSAARVLASEGVRVLVCHQTIEGSQYDNGMYAPDGIPAAEWSERFIHVISGHIHSEQLFGNIIYPGTARWDTTADANRRKGIWLYTHGSGEAGAGVLYGSEDGPERRSNLPPSARVGGSQDGVIQAAVFISTDQICSPIRSIEWREGDVEPDSWAANERISIELIGSSVWIAGQKEKLKGKCSIKTTPTDKKSANIRSTGKNFEEFMTNLFVSTMDKEHLLKYAKEIGIV